MKPFWGSEGWGVFFFFQVACSMQTFFFFLPHFLFGGHVEGLGEVNGLYLCFSSVLTPQPMQKTGDVRETRGSLEAIL